MGNILSNGEKNRCTGCGICSAVCPLNAISMKLSKDGFYLPQVDSDICCNCGKCMDTCYKYDTNFLEEKAPSCNIECFSAKNKSTDELKSSSSGAVSIELMRKCLDLKYKVVGVLYDDQREIAVTKVVATIEELELFKGSKYFQSNTEAAFREIVKDKSTQKYAVFGTPCQIYALSKYAENNNCREKFLLVDMFCHGCPSMTLWSKYITYKKKECNAESFSKIMFRSKSNGWHEFCFDFFDNKIKHTSSKYSDPFYELFFSNEVLNAACYSCIARSSLEKTDIRLGDFWGNRYDLDSEGVSAVVVCSETGKEIFNEISDSFWCEKVSFDEIAREQSYGTKYEISDYKRENMLRILNSNDNIQIVQKTYQSNMSCIQKVKRVGKIVLKHMTSNFYMHLKRIFHSNRR